MRAAEGAGRTERTPGDENRHRRDRTCRLMASARVQKLRVKARSRGGTPVNSACVCASRTASCTASERWGEGGVFAFVRRPASANLRASPKGSTPKLLQSLSCLRRWRMIGHPGFARHRRFITTRAQAPQSDVEGGTAFSRVCNYVPAIPTSGNVSPAQHLRARPTGVKRGMRFT